MNPIFKILSNLGNQVTSRIWRLGSATRLFLLTLIYSGESFRRIHLTIREIYFTGVMSLIIIVVSDGSAFNVIFLPIDLLSICIIIVLE